MKDNIKIPLNELHRKSGAEISSVFVQKWKKSDIKSLGILEFEIIKDRKSTQIDVLLRVWRNKAKGKLIEVQKIRKNEGGKICL